MSRRVLLLAFAALAGAVALIPSPAAAGDDEPEVARMWQARCASCHTVPDPALRTDRAWLDQVHRTAWTSTPARAREALIRWLGTQAEAAPRRVDAKGGAGGGAVESDIGAGSVVLQGPKGDVALVWTAGDRERTRTLPPGTYRLRTTRIERSRDGEHWFLSSTGPPGDAGIVVEAGKTARIDVKDEVRFKGQVRAHGGKVHLGFSITGADGRGLSVYRDGRRVAVTYTLLAEDGAVVAKGTMNYGWGGGGWAPVGPEDARRATKVVYAVPTGPFPLEGTLEAAFP